MTLESRFAKTLQLVPNIELTHNAAHREGEAPAEPRGGNKRNPPKDGSAGASP